MNIRKFEGTEVRAFSLNANIRATNDGTYFNHIITYDIIYVRCSNNSGSKIDKEEQKKEEKIKVSFDLNGGQSRNGSTVFATSEIKKGGRYTVPHESPVKNVNVTFDSNGGDSTPGSRKVELPLCRWEYYDPTYGQTIAVTAGNSFVLNYDTTFKPKFPVSPH